MNASKRLCSLKIFLRRILGTVVVVALPCINGVASAQTAPKADPARVSRNLFQTQADQLGARRCAGLFAALGQGLTQGAAYTLKTETNKQAPDAHSVQGVVGMTYNLPDLKGQAGGIVLATPMGQGCEGYMVRVAPFQKTCTEVLRLLPAGSVEEQSLSGVPQYRLGGNQGQALVIPSGASCVVVTFVGMAQRQ